MPPFAYEVLKVSFKNVPMLGKVFALLVLPAAVMVAAIAFTTTRMPPCRTSSRTCGLRKIA
jgi:hypothetical protein